MRPDHDLATSEAPRDEPCEVLPHPTVAAPSTPCEGGGAREIASFLRPEGVGTRRVRFQDWRELPKYREELIELRLRSLDRKSTRLNSSHLVISYAVFCLKKKKKILL